MFSSLGTACSLIVGQVGSGTGSTYGVMGSQCRGSSLEDSPELRYRRRMIQTLKNVTSVDK